MLLSQLVVVVIIIIIKSLPIYIGLSQHKNFWKQYWMNLCVGSSVFVEKMQESEEQGNSLFGTNV